jgi:hypothetical protein
LDREVWGPGVQPIVVVKDAAGVAVPGAVVAVRLTSGTATLQGTLSATTRTNGSATFADLGIAGPGTYSLSFLTSSISATSSAVKINPLPPEAATGKWDPPVAWDIIPLHISLLPTRKVLAWGKFEPNGTMGMPRLWDPATAPSSAPMVRVDTMLFCSGHTLMADGRLMVSGGHKQDTRGLDVTNIFDPATQSWVPGLPKMAKGRWYPTVTTLADGRVVTVAGRDVTSTVVLIPEIWEGNRWVRLTGASLTLPYYPRQFVAPNGRLFYAGERVKARWLDVDVVTTNGRGRWTSSAGLTHLWPYNRDYGAAVMYEAGKVLYVGGGGDPKWSTTDPKASAPTGAIPLRCTSGGGISTPRFYPTARCWSPAAPVGADSTTSPGPYTWPRAGIRALGSGLSWPATAWIECTTRYRCSSPMEGYSTGRAVTPVDIPGSPATSCSTRPISTGACGRASPVYQKRR